MEKMGGWKCEDGECVKSLEEKEQGTKNERMTETEKRNNKEHAQSTMAQKSTQTKSTVETVKQGHDKMRVLFNLYGTVLKKDAFVLLNSIKVGIFYLLCFKL